MRPTLKHCVLLLVLSWQAVSAAAAPSSPSANKVLDAIHPAAAFSPTIALIERALEKRRQEEKISKAKAAEIMAFVKRIYPVKNLNSVFKVAYGKQVPSNDVALIYQWTTTPTGIKVRQSFKRAYAAPLAVQIAFAKGIDAGKSNRRNAVETYLKISERRTYDDAWIIGAELAIARALNAYKSAAERATPEELKRSAEARRALYDGDADARTYATTMFLVKDLKNEDIDAMTAFASTSHGMAHTKAIKAALDGTFASAAATLETQLAKLKK